jgi:DNA invertase Pin-like site-specific DNA recombinase
MGMFSQQEVESRDLYREFVQAGIGLKKPEVLLTGRARRWVQSSDDAQSGSGQNTARRKPVRGLAPDMTEISRVASLHQQGMTLREIAATLDISHMTVRRYLARDASGTLL